MTCQTDLDAARMEMSAAGPNVDAALASLASMAAVMGTLLAIPGLSAAIDQNKLARRHLETSVARWLPVAMCFVTAGNNPGSAAATRLLNENILALDELRKADGLIAGAIMLSSLTLGPAALAPYGDAIARLNKVKGIIAAV
jgi:hypothetical protein